MRRSAVAPLLVGVLLGGCQKPKAELETTGQDVYVAAPEPGWYQSDRGAEPAIAPAPAAPAPDVRDPSALEVVSTTRTHQVVEGDTLYALARRYYKAPERWKDIYEANRDQLADPDLLRIDTVLVIP